MNIKHRIKMRLNYTAKARRYAFEHPLLSGILIQIIFWIIAFLLLGYLLHLSYLSFATMHGLKMNVSISPTLLISLIMGVSYGLLLGCSDYYLYRKWSKGVSIGTMILLKSTFNFLIMLLLFLFIKNIAWKEFLRSEYFNSANFSLSERVWEYYFYLALIYVLFMSIVISFIMQLNRRFGPGVLIPSLLGKYRYPIEEKRIFIFLDLKSSTTHAEKLGHVKYSQLIKDCFLEVNYISIKYSAEIYQYVGDEVILSWPFESLSNFNTVIDFYFACQSRFLKRKGRYMKKYGVLPDFKAGMHMGIVTAVEVGDVKREIAFHGDTLNVTARIQEKCNVCHADLLISEDLYKMVKTNPQYIFDNQGEASLKGRKEDIIIYKVSIS